MWAVAILLVSYAQPNNTVTLPTLNSSAFMHARFSFKWETIKQIKNTRALLGYCHYFHFYNENVKFVQGSNCKADFIFCSANIFFGMQSIVVLQLEIM